MLAQWPAEQRKIATMFKFLRSNAKFFYWVIAATFVAFIFLAWGMDIAGGGSGSVSRNAVGSVDGVEIPAWSYDRAVQEIQNGMRAQQPDRALTANQVAAARDQAWDQLVRQQILAAEVRRHGLAISDQELERIFRESPPPEIIAAFTDEEGRFDQQAYFNALGNPASGINWPLVEQMVRRSVPQQKLILMLTGGITVSEDEVREAYRQQTARAVVEYMGLPLAEQTTGYEPTEAEIEAHYEAHLGQFWQPALGHAKLAVWDFVPSPADFEEVRALSLEVKEEIESGLRTFAEAAAVYSEDGSADKGGDLGTFDRQRMVAAFTEAAFTLPVGQISEPVQTQFGFHLIEVLAQEMKDGEVERIQARHILLRVSPSEKTKEAIIERARAFRSQATAQTFLNLAEADTTCRLLSPTPQVEGRDFLGLRQSVAGNRWLFRARSQTISPLLYTDDQVYLVLSEGIQPAGPQPLDRVQSQIVLALKQEKQRQEAAAILSPAVGRVQLGDAMRAVANDLKLLYAVTDTINANSNISDVGYGTAFNSVALRAPVGELIPEVATHRGLFALRVLWRQPFDDQNYAARREQLRSVLAQRKQMEALDQWFQERIAAAKIIDRRDEYLAGA